MPTLTRTYVLPLEVIFNNRIHIFVMSILLTLFWDIVLKFHAPSTYYLMIFFNTAGVYIQNMITDREEDSINYSQAARIFEGHSKYTRYSMFACYTASFVLGALAGWKFILYGFVVNIFGGLYGHTFTSREEGKGFRIKATPWLKNAYSAIFWSAVLLITPFVYTKSDIPAVTLYAILCNFAIAYFVELLWDVRDVKGDKNAGIKTIPICFGDNITRYALHFINVFTLVLIVCGVVVEYFPAVFLIMIVHFSATPFYIQWYFGKNDKQIPSHMYIVLGTVSLFTVIALSNLLR